MAENNNNNTQFKPRPKPTLGEVKESGVRNVVGIVPRPKPNPNAPKVPARPMPPRPQNGVQPPRPRPMQGKPPRPQNAQGVKGQARPNSNPNSNLNANQNQNGQNFNNAYAYQAYTNMLNNMQFMNAVGLVNGIYQNAQNTNNKQNNYSASSIDKQTLFDEFFDYISNKMKAEGQQQGTQSNLVANVKEEAQGEAVKGAKEVGQSLDQYLEEMCVEDDFVKFGLEPLVVSETQSSPVSASMIINIKPFEIGEIVEIGEYTAEDYENLINKNYSAFFQNAQNVEEIPQEVPEEIAEDEEQSLNADFVPEQTSIEEQIDYPQEIEESLENIEPQQEENVSAEEVALAEPQNEIQETLEEPQDSTEEIQEEVDEISQVFENEQENELEAQEEVQEAEENESEQNEEIAQEIAEKAKEIEIDDAFDNLFEYDRKKKQEKEINENLFEMIEDISKVELENIKQEKIKELKTEQEKYNAEHLNKEKATSRRSQSIIELVKSDIEIPEEEAQNFELPQKDETFETKVSTDENGNEQVEVIVPQSANEKYNNIAYKALHYDEILRRENQEKEEKLLNATRKQDKLNSEITNLKNIVGSLKSELGKQEDEKLELEEMYEVTNTRNKEKELMLKENLSNIKELSEENDFMKSVVQSLMQEMEELKASLNEMKKELRKKERENKLTEQQLVSNSFAIIAPQKKTEKIKKEEIKEELAQESLLSKEEENVQAEENAIEPQIESQKDAPEVQELVENEPQIQEDETSAEQESANNKTYAVENIKVIENEDFGEEAYNIDGIIVDENSLETSGHFVDKIKLASEDIQEIYNEIRNEIMSYKLVKGRCSSACDTFRLNGDIIAKFLLIGKTMKLYLAIDPEDENLPQNIYHQKDESKKKAYKETPFMVKLQSGLSVRKAKKLISYMFEKLDVVKNPKYEEIDYVESLERQVVKSK